jgi:hypothetical protein
MKRRRTAADKKLADDQKLLRWWKAWHREQRDAVLAGPHGPVLVELLRAIANLQHIQPAQLIGLARSVSWAAIDYDTRLTVLHELNVAIMKFREKRGAEPIDDPLLHEAESPYRIIKAIMFAASPPSTRAPTGAEPGPSNSNRIHRRHEHDYECTTGGVIG